MKQKKVQEMSWITKIKPDMSQNKLWKEKKLILPWIKWIKKKLKHSNKKTQKKHLNTWLTCMHIT